MKSTAKIEGRKVALVTGASKGVGRGIALALGQAGFAVVVNYHNDQKGAEETASQIRQAGSAALVVGADVGIKAEVDRMFDVVLKEYGSLAVLVNNSGVQSWKSLLDLTEEEWDRTLRTNLKGTFLCTQRAARHMVAQHQGKIVNIGSGCNKVPFPNLVDYTSSKGGIEMFTRVAALELGPLGISVNCVAPGAIEIERTQAEAPDYAATWSPLTPMRRIGNPADVARAVVFLVSPEAEFITGQTLYVDGGLFSQGPWPYAVNRPED
ncbi:MAG TPA: 3-oxoacyl-ACP reductase family protein [Terriglobia bacterium]|nr:3-oxoacyl-ACP reductase family protein [Terriglobia bacterium]